ncbi:MAG: GNAT family N-acetyltransferase [Microcoleaceae cyanobacterium]
MNHLRVQWVDYQREYLDIQAIRHQVFEVEQNIDHHLEFDGKDEKAQHLLAYWQQQPVGTSRIRYLSPKTAKIERLAVLKEFRGQGIATKLMEFAQLTLQNTEVKEVIVHAQEYIKNLYLNLGFKVIGDRFYEANIPHLKMIYFNSTIP